MMRTYNPKYTSYFQMLMVKKELESIRHRLLSDLPNEMAVRMGVVDPLLSALGWDTRDYKKVHPEFPTHNGRVDYALCSESSEEPLSFIEAKPIGKIGDADAQLFEYVDRFQVSIAVSTDGQEWHFFYPPGEGTWEDRQLYTLDLSSDEIPKNAEFFQIYLSYQAVQSGDAANTMRMAHIIPDAWKQFMDSEDDEVRDMSLVEYFAEYFDDAIGHRPTDKQVSHVLKTYLSKSQPSPAPGPDKNQKRKRGPNERLSVRMHNGKNIDDPDQNRVLYKVMTRLVDEFGGDTVLSADKKGSNGKPFLIGDVENFRGRKKRQVIVKKYCGYYIAQDYDIDQKVEYLERLANELGIVLKISRLGLESPFV